ncbi:MAG: cytochrome bc1 complex cytochrome b subunit [Acidothermaceae bacterium]
MTFSDPGSRPTNAPSSSGTPARAQAAPRPLKKVIGEIDARFGSAGFLKRNLNKVFPDHWSFMLGEIALYSFIVLLLSGTFLTLFFRPGENMVTYQGNYMPLQGIKMTEAFESTLRLSFDIRGGLLMRQIHHWAALIFMAAIVCHMCRIFFTGAFRKPRETNWLIGFGLMTLGIFEGFCGYSLPDDLLSGTGLRIAYGVAESIPIVGTYVAEFAFGGQFPGADLIPRLYVVHILLIPGLLLGLITAHMLIMWHQKHTQWPDAHRNNTNVVGAPFYPAFMAKTGGFFFAVFAVISVLSAVVQINPVWLYGPYNPAQVGAGSQPDFYIGWLEGSLRMMPNWENNFLGHTISWNVLFPAVLLPGLLFTVIAVYPFVEAWATKDHAEHHVCDRPRNKPGRTAFGAMMIAYFAILLLAGGNDLIADHFHVSLYATTWFFRITFLVVPPFVFWLTRRACLGLQRKDLHSAEHGFETGRIVMLPNGEFIEVEAALSEDRIARMGLPYRQSAAPELPAGVDEHGVRSRTQSSIVEKVRGKVGAFIYEPAVEEEHANGHEAAHQPSLTAGSGDGTPSGD